ncbi:MAG: hypothetical protein C0622_10090 [Desulfuromonas sp.]|nr:MAG: hypothetical protein C0622_10090 [Desulfuromonas sp.]
MRLLSSPTFSFAVVTLWLLAFPMAGPLQAGNMHPDALLLFLVPHIISLVLFVLLPPKDLKALTTAGIVLAISATLVYAFFPRLTAGAIVLSGVGGAGALVHAGVQVGAGNNPPKAAGLGLILANLLLLLITQLPLPDAAKLAFVAILLGLPLFGTLIIRPRAAMKPLRYLLPFIFIYHLVAGFLYGFLLPLYQQDSWINGSELICYCLAVLIAWALFMRHRFVPLFAGVLLAIISCILLYPMTTTGINLGMWTMQGASGCVDLFLIAFLVTQKDPARAFAAGCATICSGILAGALLSGGLQGHPPALIFSGSVVLNLAAISLFLLYRRHEEQSPPKEKLTEKLPIHLAQRLSERECMVLQQVQEGARYQDVALKLSISESSVKTYMNRIYEKTGMRGKKQLLAYIDDQKSASAADTAGLVTDEELEKEGNQT